MKEYRVVEGESVAIINEMVNILFTDGWDVSGTISFALNGRAYQPLTRNVPVNKTRCVRFVGQDRCKNLVELFNATDIAELYCKEHKPTDATIDLLDNRTQAIDLGESNTDLVEHDLPRVDVINYVEDSKDESVE